MAYYDSRGNEVTLSDVIDRDYATCAGKGHETPARDYYGNYVDDTCPNCGTCLSDLDPEHEAYWAAIIKQGEL